MTYSKSKQNSSNLTTVSFSKKTDDGRGVGVKNCENFANILNGWSLIVKKGNLKILNFKLVIGSCDQDIYLEYERPLAVEGLSSRVCH